MPTASKPAPRKRQPAKPVTVKPPRTAITKYMNTLEVAYTIGQGCTVLMVNGALRGLKLYDDKTPEFVRVRGHLIRRQQTMVHTKRVGDIEAYLRTKGKIA